MCHLSLHLYTGLIEEVACRFFLYWWYDQQRKPAEFPLLSFAANLRSTALVSLSVSPHST